MSNRDARVNRLSGSVNGKWQGLDLMASQFGKAHIRHTNLPSTFHVSAIFEGSRTNRPLAGDAGASSERPMLACPAYGGRDRLKKGC